MKNYLVSMRKSVKDIDLYKQRVFLRADYNVPMNNGKIEDPYRINTTLETIQYLLDHEVKSLIIGSHLGRPKGKFDKNLSLKPVYHLLKEWFEVKNLKLEFLNVYDDLSGSSYVLLENLRFLEEEENVESERTDEYKDFFLKYADITVNDAFGLVHREAGSVTNTGLPVYASLLLNRELDIITDLESDKKDIDLIVLGGKKIREKIILIKKLIPKAHAIFIVGGMCYTFLKYNNIEIGDSYFEEDMGEIIKELYEYADEKKTTLLLPCDFVAKRGDEYVNCTKINEGFQGVDIGKETRSMLSGQIIRAKKMFWNGPPGIFEEQGSSNGTKELVEALMEANKDSLMIIAGGGDTANAISKFGNRMFFTHVSTGGGSLIALLQNQKLPGLEIICDF